MTVIDYKHLALNWRPLEGDSRNFNRILIAVILTISLLTIPLSLIKVPVENAHRRVAAPERIADFISHKEKPKVIPPKPLPKPLPRPKPKPEAVEPKNEKIQEVTRQRDKERAPLTESEVRARKVAANSGLLALANELNDLIDTSAVNTTGLAKNLSANNGNSNASQIAGHGVGEIAATVNQSAGNIDAAQYSKVAAKTDLEARTSGQDMAERKSRLEAKAAAKSNNGVSAEENVTMVFDKNKGSLYSLYERARRVTQGIQGKIVLQLTISPSGDVTDIKILSSELNNPELEAKILSRVKTFKFNLNGDKPITLNYPIEFLPS